MLELYSLRLGAGGWADFDKQIANMAEGERINRIKSIVANIATLQRWEEASGSLKRNNMPRTIYIVPNSNLLIGLDTQHGEFEIHGSKRGNHKKAWLIVLLFQYLPKKILIK